MLPPQPDSVIPLDAGRPVHPSMPGTMTEEAIKLASLRCIADMIEYFSHVSEVKQFWPNVALTLKCLSADLQKLQRDETYRSRDFPMLHGEVRGLGKAAHEKRKRRADG